ncbi:MAG TPA: carboxylating nicotinate-nucleotide diphosphorylase [Pyrinomonadaceae bacterium]|nr:carboxylating nicotinate-nucleotide diphosphorylase [Pyrinomonadaceae bacterium]
MQPQVGTYNGKSDMSAFLKQHLAEPGALESPEIIGYIRHALAEDIGSGDVTTNSIVPAEGETRARIVAKQSGIIAGLDVAQAVFTVLDDKLRFTAGVDEGEKVEHGDVVAELHGSARTLLTGERTALNFLGRMSGIATLTRQFVEAIEGTGATVLDTRKTAPGLRATDKIAVRRGGGQNHRQGLYDMILIKDNHIDYAGSLARAVKMARVQGGLLEIEVECRTIENVEEALSLGVTRILLDNMSLETMKDAVQLTAGRAKLEASGNVNLETVRAIAETGVDFISVGALTHSPKVFDVSLLVEKQAT